VLSPLEQIIAASVLFYSGMQGASGCDADDPDYPACLEIDPYPIDESDGDSHIPPAAPPLPPAPPVLPTPPPLPPAPAPAPPVLPTPPASVQPLLHPDRVSDVEGEGEVSADDLIEDAPGLEVVDEIDPEANGTTMPKSAHIVCADKA